MGFRFQHIQRFQQSVRTDLFEEGRDFEHKGHKVFNSKPSLAQSLAFALRLEIKKSDESFEQKVNQVSPILGIWFNPGIEIFLFWNGGQVVERRTEF